MSSDKTSCCNGATHPLNVRVQFNRCGSMFCGYFTCERVCNLADAIKSDRERFKRVFHRLLDDGVHLPPSPYEALFLSTAHGDAEIAATLEAFDRALAAEV